MHCSTQPTPVIPTAAIEPMSPDLERWHDAEIARWECMSPAEMLAELCDPGTDSLTWQVGTAELARRCDRRQLRRMRRVPALQAAAVNEDRRRRQRVNAASAGQRPVRSVRAPRRKHRRTVRPPATAPPDPDDPPPLPTDSLPFFPRPDIHSPIRHEVVS